MLTEQNVVIRPPWYQFGPMLALISAMTFVPRLIITHDLDRVAETLSFGVIFCITYVLGWSALSRRETLMLRPDGVVLTHLFGNDEFLPWTQITAIFEGRTLGARDLRIVGTFRCVTPRFPSHVWILPNPNFDREMALVVDWWERHRGITVPALLPYLPPPPTWAMRPPG